MGNPAPDVIHFFLSCKSKILAKYLEIRKKCAKIMYHSKKVIVVVLLATVILWIFLVHFHSKCPQSIHHKVCLTTKSFLCKNLMSQHSSWKQIIFSSPICVSLMTPFIASQAKRFIHDHRQMRKSFGWVSKLFTFQA